MDVKVGWLCGDPLVLSVDRYIFIFWEIVFFFGSEKNFEYHFSHFHENVTFFVSLTGKDMAISIFSKTQRIFISFFRFRLFLVATMVESRLFKAWQDGEKLNVKCEIMHMKETFSCSSVCGAWAQRNLDKLFKQARSYLAVISFRLSWMSWAKPMCIFS